VRRAARRTWDTYEGTSAFARAFVGARLLMLPLVAMAEEGESLKGRALSLGCGSAIVERFLAEANPSVSIDGIDHDEKRLAIAQRTADRSPRVHVQFGEIETLAAKRGPYDAILGIDIVHHLSDDVLEVLAPVAFELVAPGGVIVVKDVGDKPAWKATVNRLQDRIVAGPGPVVARAPEQAASFFVRAGFVVERVRRADRFRPHPHYLLRLRRPRHARAYHCADDRADRA
jgi:2-polyprenyl-3-methyl-5-hydroxy-6-metoxy-1,4-benzoquinol methylase